MNYFTYFMHLIAFTSPDGSKLDFGDYAAGVGMWDCLIIGVIYACMAINLWCQL